MSISSATAPVALSNNSRSEVEMPKALTITRATESVRGPVTIRRDGEPDVLLRDGLLLLTVQTEPVMPTGKFAGKRWRVYHLYSADRQNYRTVVADEGHS